MTNIRIGEETIWDFGFRYNIPVLETEELKVLMIKYEVELKRCAPGTDRHADIIKILGAIYKEVMRRNINQKLNQLEKIRI